MENFYLSGVDGAQIQGGGEINDSHKTDMFDFEDLVHQGIIKKIRLNT